MHHLANAQYWTGPASGNTGRLFQSSGVPACADRNSNCPFGRMYQRNKMLHFMPLHISKVYEY